MEILYKLDGDEAKGTYINSDSTTNGGGLLSFACTVEALTTQTLRLVLVCLD